MKKQPKIFIGMGICLAVLLAVPGIAWMTGWQWNPDAPSRLLTFFYFLTQTVSNPFGIITALFLLGALLWRLKPAKTLVWRCALLIIAPILLGQVSVGVLKRAVQEPRPFVAWLSHNQPAEIHRFYSLDTSQRSRMVLDGLKDHTAIPVWQKAHWAEQASYSFPSGHSIFAAAWAMLGVGLLWPRRRFIGATVLIAWAAGVLASRLLLGMHWPVDLLGSIGLALILTYPSIRMINRTVPV